MAAAQRTPDEGALLCCVPLEVCDLPTDCCGQPILQRELVSSGKMICTSSTCDQSGFLHSACLRKVEDILVKLLKGNLRIFGFGGPVSGMREQIKTYNWNTVTAREKIWKESGELNLYHLISRKIKCRCENGLLKRDLDWPPKHYAAPKRPPKAQAQPVSTKPKLNFRAASVITYQPMVTAQASFLKEEARTSIPGAVFADDKKVGLVTKWVGGREGWGHIQREGREERLCLVRGEVVQWMGEGGMEGRRVEYTTRKKGKKLEAVSVVLLAEEQPWLEGMVTHWVPEQLSGVVACREGEVLLERSHFVLGGFKPDIVGRRVSFRLDRDSMEARQVRAEEVVSMARDPELDGLEQKTLEDCMAELDMNSATEGEEDSEVLHLVASKLAKEELLLSSSQSTLTSSLLQTKNVRVCGVFLNRVSGVLHQVLQEAAGRRVVELLLCNSTELQAELVMEELAGTSSHGGPPLALSLALGGHGQEIMEVLVERASKEILLKLRDMFMQWGARIATSELGVCWEERIRQRVVAGNH